MKRRQELAADRVLINGRLVATGANTHGVHSTYTNWLCRCPPCTDANRRYSEERRLRRRADRVEINGRMVAVRAHTHGSASTYANWECRCPPCTAAWALVARRR